MQFEVGEGRQKVSGIIVDVGVWHMKLDSFVNSTDIFCDLCNCSNYLLEAVP